GKIAMDLLTSFSAIILDIAVKATVLLALAWMGVPLLKRSSAATCYMMRSLVLGALLLLPFSGLLPACPVKRIPQFPPHSASVTPPARWADASETAGAAVSTSAGPALVAETRAQASRRAHVATTTPRYTTPVREVSRQVEQTQPATPRFALASPSPQMP